MMDKEFVAMHEKMHKTIHTLRRKLHSRMERQVQKYGLNEQQAMALLFFAHSGLDTATALAKARGFSRSLASKTIDSLVKKEMLATRKSQTDRRIVHVVLTPHAQATVTELGKARDEIMCGMLKGVTKEEMMQIEGVCEKLMRNMEQME